jgi:hypothetical protein
MYNGWLMCTLRILATTVSIVLLSNTALAQDVGNIILLVAEGLRTGALSMFSDRIRHQIIITGGLADYQKFLTLWGPVNNVDMVQMFPINSARLGPGAEIHGRVIQTHGYSDWTVDYSYVTRKVEMVKMTGSRLTSPPSAEPDPSTAPTPGRLPPSTDVACQQYPGLC